MVEYGKEIRQSEWNSASYKMMRLHQIMDKLNKLNQSPLSFDETNGEENHFLIFRCCDSLYQEVQASLTDTERERAETFRDTLRNSMDKFPIRVQLKRDGKPTQKFALQQENWDIIKKGLWIYEKMVREFILKAGMDTAESSDFGGWD